MELSDDDIRKAIGQTKVLHYPKQSLATFGVTVIDYYLLSTPVYEESTKNEETVIREGKVSAERPRIVTPYFLSRLEGFSDNAKRYLDFVTKYYGPHTPGLLYTYRNETKELSIVSENLDSLALKIKDDVDKRDEKLCAIVKGVDQFWDISLLKFISDLTENSLKSNITELDRRGLLAVDQVGIPREARLRIDELFHKVALGECNPSDLKKEIDRWDLFSEYEDKFLSLFRGK